MHPLTVVHLGRATMLVSAADVADTAETVHARLRRELGTPVRVVSERVTDESWGRAFELAGRCCGLMKSLGIVDQGSTADQYAMFAVLFDAERSQDLDRFLDDTILGEDWRMPDSALQLHIALRLHALRTANDPI